MDKKGCIGVLVWMLLIFICGIILIAFGSCRSIKHVPIETIKHDSVYITQHQKDSIYIHDSIYQKEKGDTVLIEKWHTKYIEKQVHDTTYVATHDTIPQPYPVTKYVEHKRSKTDWFFIITGIIALIAVIVYAAVKVRKFLP